MKIIKDNSDNKVYTCNKINNTTQLYMIMLKIYTKN